MKFKSIVLLLFSAAVIAPGCGRPEIDYSEWYLPDEPEIPVDPDEPDGPDTPDVPKNEQIKVISFNVRYANGDAGTSHSWDNRKAAVPVMVETLQPTFMGVQEAQPLQREYMDENLGGYRSIGVGREDGNNKGEMMAIYYDEDKAALEKWGTFWLSETPDVPSKGWDANNIRCATWAVFKMKNSGNRLFYINTHIDHLGTTARSESMKLIEAKMKELNTDGLPMLLSADFNTTVSDSIFDGIKVFMKDTRTESPVTDNWGSFNNYGASSATKIDIIFYSGFTPVSFETVRTVFAGVTYISDHYPVSAVLEFQ